MKPPTLPPVGTNKPLPVEYRYQIILDWHSNLTFWERICVLFGCGILLRIAVVTRHDPGPWQPVVCSKVTKSTTPDEHHREYVEQMLKSKKESPIQNEPSQQN